MTVLLEQMVLYLAKVHDVERVVNISFVNCGLTDVSIVQRMAKLEIASLSVNGITSLKVFAGCTMLKKLYLRSNKIEDINEVEHIRNLLHLEDFTLEGNPCVKRAGPWYRGILLRTLRTLKIIDTTQVTGEEVRNALWNSNPPVMHDEHNEESLNPFDAYHQSAQQMSCSASPQMEQLVQVSPRPRRPFTAGQQEQELSPDPPRHSLNGSCSPVDSCFGRNISRENYRQMGPADKAPSASVQPVRDYRCQALDLGRNFIDFEQQLQQLKLQHLQLQLQMRQQQPPLHSYGNGGLEMVPQQSYRSYPGRGQRNTNSPVASPQWRTGNCENCQFGNEQYGNVESPQSLMRSPCGGYNILRRGQPVHNNNNLSAIIYLLQELDLAALQELDAAVSKRLRDLTRD